MLAWVRSYGVDIKAYTKEDLTDLLKRDLPAKVRRALEIRQEAGRTSTAKYQALIDATSADGRLRGAIQYYGAQRTGRFAGRRFQPHNLPHPEIPDSDNGAEALINDIVDLLFEESVMAVAVSCVRSCIKVPPGKQLIVSDLSNIEGRDLAWLAGETWKIKAFNDFDTIIGYDDKGKAIRMGPDLYMLSYHKSFGVPLADITYDERQIGKVQELSLQYQGGVGAFYKMAKKFNLDLEDVYDQVIDLATEAQLESAYWMVDWIRANRPDLNDLSDKGIIGADLVKQSWRESHPAIVQYWYTLESMVRQAIENGEEGLAFAAGRIKASCRGDKLLIMLPSKRVLVYNRPGIRKDGSMYYMRYDDKKRNWYRSALYGGLLAENVTQASARDVLTYNMPDIDALFPIIGTVHDEDITEVDSDSPHTLKELNEMLVQHPPWASGMPLAAAGYVSQRYKKD
jgi:DNA polymerase